MTLMKRRWVWFVGIYIASLAAYATCVFLVRALAQFAF